MTQIDIAALVADREAGTKGPWRVRVNKRDDQYTCDVSICGDIFVLADLNGPQYVHQHANARRIARVPDMEAALIAQDAELKRLREALTEAKETLVEVKRDMWREAAPRWIMADFLNWAIVQRITASIVSTRAALGEKP